jgi:lipopolysaccharide/colanic/teichoic acid biosynthesis glycosyltransferase
MDMYPAAKRLFDILFSLIGLVVLSPLLAVISLLIKRDSEGPVFYRGVRVGKGGEPFKMYKFRTMVVDAEQIGGCATPDDDPRLTGVGRFLRQYKLDELPQLIDVLRGEMSLVGPRPQVEWIVDLYTPEERQLLTVRPGITDPASLRFVNHGEILKGSTDPEREYLEKIHPEKMCLSLEYVRNRSFWVDIKIILQTIASIIKHRKGGSYGDETGSLPKAGHGIDRYPAADFDPALQSHANNPPGRGKAGGGTPGWGNQVPGSPLYRSGGGGRRGMRPSG